MQIQVSSQDQKRRHYRNLLRASSPLMLLVLKGEQSLVYKDQDIYLAASTFL